MDPSEPIPPKVFISYSQDSSEHQDHVLALADRLRTDGIDAQIDQYDTAPADGWPLWMIREIEKSDFVLLICTETYRSRAENGEQPGKGRGVLWEAKLIYNDLYVADSPKQKYIPIVFSNSVPDNIPAALRTLSYYNPDTSDGYESLYRHLTDQPKHSKPTVGERKPLPPKKPQSFPASLGLGPDSSVNANRDLRNRLTILKRIRQDWINGVLKQSLYQVARLELRLEASAVAVANAFKQLPNSAPCPIPPGTPISQIFSEAGEALLILGAPGAGKTTLLLELAECLLDRAERDPTYPIPTVFNLSSWILRRAPIDQWMISELHERMEVPKRVAQAWVKTEQILPLLDGLDEVAEQHRVSCVEAINQFRRDHGLLPIAVCSRIADYESIGVKIRLRSAIVAQQLTASQVEDFLRQGGQAMAEFSAVVQASPSLAQLIDSPLMLWVAMLASKNADVRIRSADSLGEQRNALFSAFVDAMFSRKHEDERYPKNAVTAWLSWLAVRLDRNKQTIFYLEDLDISWLQTRMQRFVSAAATIGACGLFGLISAILFIVVIGFTDAGGAYGILFAFVFGGVAGPVCGILGALIGLRLKLRPVEVFRLRLRAFTQGLRRAVWPSLAAGLVAGSLIFATWGYFSSPVQAAFIGSFSAIFVGFSVGFLSLVTTDAVDIRRKPNEGTLKSRRSALLVPSFAALICLILVGLDWATHSGGSITAVLLFYLGTFCGLSAVVLGTLFGGGLFAIKHYIVRAVISLSRLAPLRIVPFLNYATDRILLRRVGGGYIFAHRMLLDYFVALDQSKQPQPVEVKAASA